jgi:hypothetical protein
MTGMEGPEANYGELAFRGYRLGSREGRPQGSQLRLLGHGGGRGRAVSAEIHLVAPLRKRSRIEWRGGGAMAGIEATFYQCANDAPRYLQGAQVAQQGRISPISPPSCPPSGPKPHYSSFRDSKMPSPTPKALSTRTEWTTESPRPFQSNGVFSEVNIGKKRTKGDGDKADISTCDLLFPATTCRNAGSRRTAAIFIQSSTRTPTL